MTYSVKDIFYTLQGEGANAGRPAVFCRFTGCNLWSGHEVDRQKAICKFCDTDFVGTDGDGGGRFKMAATLATAILGHWPDTNSEDRFVVCTGGEPLLQLDDALIAELHKRDFEIAIETNGTIEAPADIDWVCVSPKAGAKMSLLAGDELKLIYPQIGAAPESYEHLLFRYWYLQPMDGPHREANTAHAVEYCKFNPRWRLSLQTHKLVGIP